MEITYLLYGLITLSIISFITLSRKSSKRAKQHDLEKKVLEQDLDIALTQNDPKNIVRSNIELVEKYYDQNLNQHRITHLTTLGISVLGVVTILIGVILAIDQDLSEIGKLTTISGIVVELVSALFFYQNRKTTNLIRANHKSLQSGLDIQNAISLIEMLPKTERNKEIQKIIKYLLDRAKLEGIIKKDE